MNLSLSIGIVVLLGPMAAQASVTKVWSPTDAAAASAWLSGIEDTGSAQATVPLYRFSTDESLGLSAPIIAHLTVWGDHAELNILGTGALPSLLQLWSSFPGRGTILEILQGEFVVADPAEGSLFSYASSFAVEESFPRVVFNSAATDGLLLLADLGTPAANTYTFRAVAVPEPEALALLAMATMLLLHRRIRPRFTPLGE